MAFTVSAAQVFAQGKVVTGKVSDEKDGAPLNGVSVVVKGTSIGTTTSKMDYLVSMFLLEQRHLFSALWILPRPKLLSAESL